MYLNIIQIKAVTQCVHIIRFHIMEFIEDDLILYQI